MWHAAESGDLATALIPAVWTFLGVVVITLGTIAVQSMKARSERPESTTTGNGNGNGASLLQVARDVAKDLGQLTQRADDNDDRDDMQDRHLDRQDERIEALERYNDLTDPDWRRP